MSGPKRNSQLSQSSDEETTNSQIGIEEEQETLSQEEETHSQESQQGTDEEREEEETHSQEEEEYGLRELFDEKEEGLGLRELFNEEQAQAPLNEEQVQPNEEQAQAPLNEEQAQPNEEQAQAPLNEEQVQPNEEQAEENNEEEGALEEIQDPHQEQPNIELLEREEEAHAAGGFRRQFDAFALQAKKQSLKLKANLQIMRLSRLIRSAELQQNKDELERYLNVLKIFPLEPLTNDKLQSYQAEIQIFKKGVDRLDQYLKLCDKTKKEFPLYLLNNDNDLKRSLTALQNNVSNFNVSDEEFTQSLGVVNTNIGTLTDQKTHITQILRVDRKLGIDAKRSNPNLGEADKKILESYDRNINQLKKLLNYFANNYYKKRDPLQDSQKFIELIVILKHEFKLPDEAQINQALVFIRDAYTLNLNRLEKLAEFKYELEEAKKNYKAFIEDDHLQPFFTDLRNFENAQENNIEDRLAALKDITDPRAKEKKYLDDLIAQTYTTEDDPAKRFMKERLISHLRHFKSYYEGQSQEDKAHEADYISDQNRADEIRYLCTELDININPDQGQDVLLEENQNAFNGLNQIFAHFEIADESKTPNELMVLYIELKQLQKKYQDLLDDALRDLNPNSEDIKMLKKAIHHFEAATYDLQVFINALRDNADFVNGKFISKSEINNEKEYRIKYNLTTIYERLTYHLNEASILTPGPGINVIRNENLDAKANTALDYLKGNDIKNPIKDLIKKACTYDPQDNNQSILKLLKLKYEIRTWPTTPAKIRIQKKLKAFMDFRILQVEVTKFNPEGGNPLPDSHLDQLLSVGLSNRDAYNALQSDPEKQNLIKKCIELFKAKLQSDFLDLNIASKEYAASLSQEELTVLNEGIAEIKTRFSLVDPVVMDLDILGNEPTIVDLTNPTPDEKKQRQEYLENLEGIKDKHKDFISIKKNFESLEKLFSLLNEKIDKAPKNKKLNNELFSKKENLKLFINKLESKLRRYEYLLRKSYYDRPTEDQQRNIQGKLLRLNALKQKIKDFGTKLNGLQPTNEIKLISTGKVKVFMLKEAENSEARVQKCNEFLNNANANANGAIEINRNDNLNCDREWYQDLVEARNHGGQATALKIATIPSYDEQDKKLTHQLFCNNIEILTPFEIRVRTANLSYPKIQIPNIKWFELALHQIELIEANNPDPDNNQVRFKDENLPRNFSEAMYLLLRHRGYDVKVIGNGYLAPKESELKVKLKALDLMISGDLKSADNKTFSAIDESVEKQKNLTEKAKKGIRYRQ